MGKSAIWRNVREAAELVWICAVAAFVTGLSIGALVLMLATPFIAVGLGLGVIVWVIRLVAGF